MGKGNLPEEDGLVEVQGIKIYYRRLGKGNRYKLLTLHGGPGTPHQYLSPLEDLVQRDFEVVFYDQFGCGKSDYPKNKSDYSLEYAVEETEGVRKALFGDSRVHLFGNSWGGMLALAYAIKYQDHLKSLTSCSGLSSGSQVISEMRKLISRMPEKYRNYIEKHEKDGDFGNPEYIEATTYFYRQHVIRMDTWPEDLVSAVENATERGTYAIMSGPSEFTITGVIKDIEFTDELHKIRVPALITCGRYDEVTPAIAETLHENIKNSEMVVFPESSHLQFWEERRKYIEVLENFVKKHD